MTRRQEYTFLLLTVALASGYGLIHDFITCSISTDYFVIGKGIASASTGFNVDVAVLALSGSWWVGLMAGALCLFANRPDKMNRQLAFRDLLRFLPIPFTASILCAAILGLCYALYAAPLASITGMEFPFEWGGRALMSVWGIHTGSYLGGMIGTIIMCMRIGRGKRGLDESRLVILPRSRSTRRPRGIRHWVW